MSSLREQRREKLRQLYESGHLDEATYQALLADLALAERSRPGAVDLDESRVVGSIVTGTVTAGRDFAGRDIIHNTYYGAPAQDPAEALQIYRRVVAAGSGYLPLRGLNVGASDPTAVQKPLGLANVYIALDTKSQISLTKKEREQRGPTVPSGQDSRTMPALEAAAANRRLILLGDPGSGKSTFVNYLAHNLAVSGLQPGEDSLGLLPGWPAADASLFPVLIILRDFARSLPNPLPHPATPHHLWAFLERRLEAQNLDFAAGPIQEVLEQGRALLLLDGLDEVPTAAQRIFVRDAVEAFVGRYPDNRVLLTCRVLAYQPPASPDEPDMRLPAGRFPPYELAPFDGDKVDRFIEAWYRELAQVGTVRPESISELTHRLQMAVRRPDLRLLATNPLLLTVMALVHTHHGRLPNARALLYEETVEMLLWRWEQVKVGEQGEAPSLRQLLLMAGRSDMDLKRLLWRLAFEAQAATGVEEANEPAGIDELALRRALAALKGGDWNWAEQLVEMMKVRAGLLLERAPGTFTLPHRTFQEYLAGAHLAAQGNFARQGAALAGEGTLWREVILLAVGRLVYLSGDVDKPLALVNRLCPAGFEASETTWRQVWLAGDTLIEMGLKRVQDDALGRELQERVRRRLALLVAQGELSPRERAEAGNTLARLGDPRRGVGVRLVEDQALPDIALCYIPPGPFWMGSNRDDGLAEKREKPLHQLNIPYDYWLARYPVTLAQFRAFVEQSGYEPASGESLDGLSNHPVMWMTWDDALAFCRWLDGQWRGRGWLPPDYQVTLPSEAEWEKAARGGLEIPAQPVVTYPGDDSGLAAGQYDRVTNPWPRRRYPWGDEWEAGRANGKESGIGASSAVGAFPNGSSPYGLLEMSGNVWEWTRTRWGQDWEEPDFTYPYQPEDGREDLQSDDLRVVRGGTFSNSKPWLRCTFRDWNYPDFGDIYYGFRVCVSPFPGSRLAAAGSDL